MRKSLSRRKQEQHFQEETDFLEAFLGAITFLPEMLFQRGRTFLGGMAFLVEITFLAGMPFQQERAFLGGMAFLVKMPFIEEEHFLEARPF